MSTEDYTDEMDDLHERVHELEQENERLSAKEEELKELCSTEICSFCHVPQLDWTTLLQHYSECPEIQRTRLML